MEQLIVRAINSALVGVVTFFGLFGMGVSIGSALAVAAIPIVLGTLNILVASTYRTAGLVFVVGMLNFALSEGDIMSTTGNIISKSMAYADANKR